MYDLQQKYISSLVKQLPSSSSFSTNGRVKVSPPTTIRASVARQGPFLLQPAPCMIEGSEGGDATDILYIDCGRRVTSSVEDEDEEVGGAARLGMLLVAYRDGKVDVCLDVEKVEAKWSMKTVSALLLTLSSSLSSKKRQNRKQTRAYRC